VDTADLDGKQASRLNYKERSSVLCIVS